MTTQQLQDFRDTMKLHLTQIRMTSEHFGFSRDTTGVTIIVRDPADPNCWLVMTNDDAIAVATRMLNLSEGE